MKNKLFKQQQQVHLIAFKLQGQKTKVQFGNIASDARGKIGGTTYSKNRSGAYAKRKTSPTNRNTTAQSVVRTNFTGLTKAWGSVLSGAQQTEWNNFATLWPRTDVFGNSVKISGQNMFISLGQRALQIGLPYLLDPPADLSVIPIPIDPTSLEVNPATIQFAQNGAAADATQLFYIFATPPLPPGRQPKSSDFRFIASQAGAVAPYPAEVSMTAAYIAVFGAPSTGSRVGFAVGTINNVTFGVDQAVQMNVITS